MAAYPPLARDCLFRVYAYIFLGRCPLLARDAFLRLLFCLRFPAHVVVSVRNTAGAGVGDPGREGPPQRCGGASDAVPRARAAGFRRPPERGSLVSGICFVVSSCTGMTYCTHRLSHFSLCVLQLALRVHHKIPVHNTLMRGTPFCQACYVVLAP